MSYETLGTKDTGYYADTVEWCPIKGFRSVLVCGTYQLIEAHEGNESCCSSESQNGGLSDSQSSRRVGNIQLYQLDNQSRRDLKRLLISDEGAGILDTKWYPNAVSGQAILGAVSAESELKIFTLSVAKESNVELIENNTTYIGRNKICLSLDWSSSNEQSGPKCVVSDSQGQLTILQCSEASWEARQIMQWTGHKYEAWITAFDRWTPHVVYSGADDCLLKGWDTRTDCRQSIFTSRKHEMGVSSIQCNPVHEYIMATGSYDENILVWDTRNMKVPLCSACPGGGVWRIKWHPYTGEHMLTASMYEGYHILKYSYEKDSHGLEVIASYTRNAQLAYGADWCQQDRDQSTSDIHDSQANSTLSTTERTTQSNYNLIATCSFYDHILHLWKICL